jgi:hypothetical protein
MIIIVIIITMNDVYIYYVITGSIIPKRNQTNHHPTIKHHKHHNQTRLGLVRTLAESFSNRSGSSWSAVLRTAQAEKWSWRFGGVHLEK